MAKVNEIYQSLDKTNGSLYTSEQKRVLAHMIELGRHSSQTSPLISIFSRNLHQVLMLTQHMLVHYPDHQERKLKFEVSALISCKSGMSC